MRLHLHRHMHMHIVHADAHTLLSGLNDHPFRDVALYLRKHFVPGTGRGFPELILKAFKAVPMEHVRNSVKSVIFQKSPRATVGCIFFVC